VKRYMMILSLALLLGSCMYPGECVGNFCLTKPPPSDPVGTVLDGSIYRDGSICGTPLAPHHVTCIASRPPPSP